MAEARELPAQCKDACYLRSAKKGVERALLHSHHLILERRDKRKISIDDEVQDCMEDIVGALAEQVGRAFKLLTQRKMRSGGALPYRDNVTVTKENGGLPVGDTAVV